ncbi:class I SAM-dependent methyltransferase [Parendozoicomonas haliclonae]|uniref:Tellurite resistance methyltransferase TehB-like domain-containing protein n=1 Tax=Parendozoicomonas haliclonae TaxID=1960125 RepID=A0A1X7AMA4_9GAMM|nr:hypothetical protein [Parendozoicomonas haliclonae]SMA49376.1 hypothetical protein EHSB41UT_03220 [Parendozoicomonas haliclonae]
MSDSESTQQSYRKIIAHYSSRADELGAQYDALPATQVHGQWMHTLPKAPGLALDIGAGSGRDAAWLSSLGFDVVAVEPAEGLRNRARET